MTDKIGKYEVVEKIGVGGFGTVYRGRDPFIKRIVAIKTCQSDDEEIKKRFFREAEFAGNLHHRNITTIYDFGVENGTPFLVQEYLTGEDLDKIIKRGDPLPLARKIEILNAICDGLAYAHANGIIHRDMKPGNVRVLEDGTVKIMDFGIAKSFQSESTLTQTGITLGTAAYLAPEQIRGEAVSPATDIFSLGVLAYELLTYRKPFRGEHISTVLFRILNENPEPITTLVPDCPPALEEAVNRTMEKNPAARYQSALQFQRALGEVAKTLASADSTTLPVSRRESDTVTVFTRRGPAAPENAGASVTPPSGMLARVHAETPQAAATPTPRSLSLELVDFRNPQGTPASPAEAGTPARTTHGATVKKKKHGGIIALVIVVLVAAASAGYFFLLRPPAQVRSTAAAAPPIPVPPKPLPVTNSPASTTEGSASTATTVPAPATATSPAPAVSSKTQPPPVPAPKKVKAPPPLKSYEIQFWTQPSAELTIDGKHYGKTMPVRTVKLKEGAHTIRFELEDGTAHTQSLTVSKNGRRRIVYIFPGAHG